MNIQLFQQVAQLLLKTHYGHDLNDTRLSEPDYVAVVMENATRPFEYLNMHAEDTDLDRIDLESYGIPSKAALTLRDELRALGQVNPIEVLGEQPATCPHCAARTDFDVLEAGLYNPEEKQQHHRCLAQACGYEFLSEEDDEDPPVALLQVVTDGIAVSVQMPSVINDGYAETIIGDRAHDYDALEIQGVCDIGDPNDPNGTCCEVDNDNPQFFSVYAHLVRGGVECVGDFGTHALALKYARILRIQYGWTIFDYVNSRFKAPLAA